MTAGTTFTPERARPEASVRCGAAVRVLVEDPDLGLLLDADELAPASRSAVARVLEAEPGAVTVPRAGPLAHPGALGLLVLDGMLTRTVTIGRSRAAELLGAGDVLRPWVPDDEYTADPVPAVWRVAQPTRLAVLDSAFARRIAAWPQLHDALLDRAVQRARRLAFLMALSHVKRVDVRLLLLLWRLADRWGRTSHDGIVLPLRLTHATLGTLIGAQRPSVTTALKNLATRGVVERRPDGGWLLRGERPDFSAY